MRLTPFSELTDDELLDLTDEDIEFYKQREALNSGVVIAPKPPPEPKKPFFQASLTLYAITGITLETGGRDILFSNKEDALLIIEHLQRLIQTGRLMKSAYEYSCGYTEEYVEELDVKELSIKNKMLYSPEEFQVARTALAKYEAEHNEWQKLENAYIHYVSELRDNVRYIVEAITEARKRKKAKEALIAAWKQYRVLDTEDNALVFFALAYNAALEENKFTAIQIRDWEAKEREGVENVTAKQTGSETEGKPAE
jgi:hypothetical protein